MSNFAHTRDALNESRDATITAAVFLDGLAFLAEEGSIPEDGAPMRRMASALLEAMRTIDAAVAKLREHDRAVPLDSDRD